jgi:hypothetical protein
VLNSFFSGWAFLNIVSQKLRNEVFGSLADAGPRLVFKIELSNLNGFHDLLVRTTVKRWNSRKNDISDDACGPDVTLLSIVPVQNFWCDVVGRSNLLAKLLLRIKNLSSSKINHLDLVKLLTSL